MPRLKEHAKGGVIASWIPIAIYSFIHWRVPTVFLDYNWVILAALVSGIGLISGILPDKIDPPTMDGVPNPRHQGFGHWIIGGGIILALLLIYWNKPLDLKNAFDTVQGLLALSFASGYISHLSLDVWAKIH